MKNYTQLSLEEREEIMALRYTKRSIRDIARLLGRTPSTVSRELRRNGTGTTKRHYVPHRAHEAAHERIQKRGQRPRLKSTRIRTYVHEKLPLGWSPEQIAGRLHRDHPHLHISPEAIYQYVYAGVNLYGNCAGEDLRPLLRRAHKLRRHRGVRHAYHGTITGRIGIEERPAEVAARKVVGHWEGDTMVSKKSTVALQSLVERVTGLLKLSKLPSLHAAPMTEKIIHRLSILPLLARKTLTFDNGHENAGHRMVSNVLGMSCYFAHPYHSWERGTNENTNGLVRWYLPKRTDFATVSEGEIACIEQAINTRPRKRLHYRTPLEVFNQRVALEGGM